MRCVEEGSASIRGYITNATFGLSVLMVSIHAAKRHGMVGSTNTAAKEFGIKKAIDAMIVRCDNIIRSKETFKSKFCFDGSCCIHLSHEMAVREIGEMIYKNGSPNVSLFFLDYHDALEQSQMLA